MTSETGFGEALPMDLEMARKMGAQGADIATLKDEVQKLRDDVSEIKEMLATNRGGVRMLLAVGGIAASLGGCGGFANRGMAEVDA